MFLTQQKQAGRLLYAGMVPSKIPCQLPPPEMPQVLPRLLSFLNITFPGPPPLWLLAVLLLSQELACLGTGEKNQNFTTPPVLPKYSRALAHSESHGKKSQEHPGVGSSHPFPLFPKTL